MSPIKSSVIMTTAKPERKVRQAILALLTIALLPSGLSQAQESDDPAGKEAPSWYQVEVVIFTQQGYAGNEQPPREVVLEFHDNTVELLDPEESASHSFPLAAGVISTLNQPLIPYVEAQDPALAIADTQSPSAPDEYDLALALANSEDAVYLANNLPANIAAVEQPYVAQYEPTFIKLPREARNLNESAAALDRQLQYNLLFHEAWRFSATENGDDPWILIKAGKQYLDRFEIEGSLRFYKSRFLHFQSDLWLVEFDPQNAADKMIELPEFPVYDKPDLAEYPIIGELQFDPDRIEDFFIDQPHNAIDENSDLAASNGGKINSSISPQQTDQVKTYPIASLWTFDQSKRIEEQQSYYIDHPKMGILLTVIPYQPQPLNSPKPEQQSDPTP